ncbi:unnamed protein product [Medioppia subpectinata]|uniref:Uncharacterized protein n=1 Tax=Medioppia subpectinata TaxID=1979941 RepID=A0A7R9KK14_9ACAR|nr:unnamed protein product [Medioppia subpectinata]CAG2103782.1 unnamed protein product [Medioppia subpectinata]
MLILFVILASTFLINYAHAQTCNAKTLRKVDLSVARIITIGNSGRQFPEQKGTELKKYCSEYYRIFPCIITKTKRIPVCTEQHVDTAMNFVRSMLGNAIDLLCSEYSEGSDKCDTLGRPPRKLKHQRRTKSFLIPLLDMFDSFPEV